MWQRWQHLPWSIGYCWHWQVDWYCVHLIDNNFAMNLKLAHWIDRIGIQLKTHKFKPKTERWITVTKKMQVREVLFCYLILVVIKQHSGDNLKSNFESVECKAPNETVLSVRSCVVKMSTNSSKLVLNLTLPQSLKPLLVKFDVSYKQKKNYLKILEMPEFELCAVMKSENSSSPLIDSMTYLLTKDSFTAIVRGCPYFGDIDMAIAIDNSKLSSIILTGMYQIDFLLKRKSAKLFAMTVIVEVFMNKRKVQ